MAKGVRLHKRIHRKLAKTAIDQDVDMDDLANGLLERALDEPKLIEDVIEKEFDFEDVEENREEEGIE